jgi:protein-tyrosine phosphatase
MNTIYYLISYLRIIPRKTAIAAYNYYYGIKHLPAIRMEKLPLTNRVWNHITNLYIEPTEILPGLYLGNAYNASNYSTIEYYNIKNILNISKELPNYFENNTNITYKKIEIIDDAENHITEWIQNIIEFVDNKEINTENSLLVHCYMGSSRSASVILIILIYKYGFTFDEALTLIKSKRDIVNINTNFLEDIKIWITEKNIDSSFKV